MLGNIALGISQAFSDNLTKERQRQRQLEDQDLDNKIGMLKAIMDSPNARPEMYGQILHDIMALQSAKSGQRKLKKGMAGMMGATELPISQFLQGFSQVPGQGGTPQGPYGSDSEGVYLAPPKTDAQSLVDQVGSMAPQQLGLTGASVLGAPVPVPPPGMAEGVVANKSMLGAAQQFKQQQALNPPPQQTAKPLSPFKTTEEINAEATRAAVQRQSALTAGKIGDIRTHVTNPQDQEAAIGHEMGVPTDPNPFLGTASKTYKRPDGSTFIGTPLRAGGFRNHSTGMTEYDAVEAPTQSNRAPTIVEMASLELFGTPDARSLEPEQATQLREFINSDKFAEYAKKLARQHEYEVALAWARPREIQGMDPSTLQPVTAFQSAGGAGVRGTPSLPPRVDPTQVPGSVQSPQQAIPPAPTSQSGRVTVTPPVVQSTPIPTGKPQATAKPAPAPARPTPTSRGALATAPGGGINRPPTADMVNQAQSFTTVPNLLTDLNNTITEINTIAGPVGKVAGFGKTILSHANMQDQVQFYNRTKQGFLASLARVYGEKGVLTDPDVIRAANTLPNVGDNPEYTKRAMAAVTRFFADKQAGLPTPFSKYEAEYGLTGGTRQQPTNQQMPEVGSPVTVGGQPGYIFMGINPQTGKPILKRQ